MFLVTAASEPQTPAQTIDYNFAREELMLNELSNDPLQTAIAKIERQHEEDKQGECLWIKPLNHSTQSFDMLFFIVL